MFSLFSHLNIALHNFVLELFRAIKKIKKIRLFNKFVHTFAAIESLIFWKMKISILLLKRALSIWTL